MKRYIIIMALLIGGISVSAQSLEFRLRGGANFQKSNMDDKEFSFLPHIGASAGIRISTIGVYGEFLYSIHEDINGIAEINYLIPSLQVRLYAFRYMYAELGFGYLVLNKDVEGGLLDNPNKEGTYYIGFGASLRKIEFGIRTMGQPSTTIQLTASYRF